jgi:hypothetical protein
MAGVTNLQWRKFDDLHNGYVQVTVYQTPIGAVCDAASAHLVSKQVVSAAEAVVLLRKG